MTVTVEMIAMTVEIASGTRPVGIAHVHQAIVVIMTGMMIDVLTTGAVHLPRGGMMTGDTTTGAIAGEMTGAIQKNAGMVTVVGTVVAAGRLFLSFLLPL